MVSDFGSRPRKAGRKDSDAYLDAKFPTLARGLRRSREFLGDLGDPRRSRMARIFDEMYLGKALYKESYGVPSKGPAKGLIEMEKTLVKESTLRALEGIVGRGRLALITGRPSKGTAYSLGEAVMRHFDIEASIFIGDADLVPRMRAEYGKFRKPSPEALIRAKEKLSSKTLLYVGDSGEDLMMVRDGTRQGRLKGCIFAGVYGTSPDHEKQVSFFRKNGADVVVKSVNEIPSRLLMASKKLVTQAN